MLFRSVAATGAHARALGLALLRRDDEALARLSGVAGRGVLLVTGASDELPWCDGAVYLGRDPDAPGLLLSTTSRPSVHAGLLERALLAKARPPLAVLHGSGVLVSLEAARPLVRRLLDDWMEDEA